MDLYKEILVQVLAKQAVEVHFSGIHMDVNAIVETECYKALEKIRAVIRDDSLEDDECFMKIEEIICTLEDLGSHGGHRHDFG